MAMTLSPSHAPHADPNVTPLIDVLLVLLIIFMVIVPVTPKGLTALIPQPPKSAQPDTGRSVVLEILAAPHGPTYQLNGERIEGNSHLAAELNRIYATRADKVLFVKGDPALSFNAVAEVMDLSHAAGVDHIGILTPAVAHD